MDEGALCLSWLGCDYAGSHNPTESCGEQDKHKALSHPHIFPLSLLVEQHASGQHNQYRDSNGSQRHEQQPPVLIAHVFGYL